MLTVQQKTIRRIPLQKLYIVSVFLLICISFPNKATLGASPATKTPQKSGASETPLPETIESAQSKSPVLVPNKWIHAELIRVVDGFVLFATSFDPKYLPGLLAMGYRNVSNINSVSNRTIFDRRLFHILPLGQKITESQLKSQLGKPIDLLLATESGQSVIANWKAAR